MFGLKMEQGCSVVMGESCKKQTNKKNHITFTDTQDQVYFIVLLNLCTYHSLIVLRRGDGAWRQVLAMPQSAKGCLIGCGQQGGRAVSQSAHAGDGCLRD